MTCSNCSDHNVRQGAAVHHQKSPATGPHGDPFLDLIEAMPVAALICQADGTLTTINTLCRRLWQMEDTTPVSGNIRQDHQACHSALDQAFPVVLAGHPQQLPEVEYDPCAHGYAASRYRATLSLVALPGHQHDSPLVLVLHDLSTSQQIRDFQELTLSSINEAVMVVQDDRIRYFNQKALDLAGHTHAETYQDQPIADFIHPDFRQTVLDRHRRRLRGEDAPSSYQLQILHAKGQAVWLQLNAMRIDWRGRPASLVFLSDISDQKRMESLLQQAKEDWENTFNAIDEAILSIDPDHTITQANRAASVLFNRPIHTLIGAKCYELMHGAEQPITDCLCPSVFRNRVPISTERMEPHLDKFLSIKCFPKIDRTGRLTGIIHVTHDITAEKRAIAEHRELEAQLIQAQKMESIGTLAGGIAHDFNNLLTAILGFSELTLLDLGADHPACSHLKEVLTAGRRAKNLVRQILTFSHKTEEDRQPLDLAPLVKETISLLKASLPKNISIRSSLAKDCGPIFGDSAQMHQILMNLCTNACHAMQESGGLLEINVTPVFIDSPLPNVTTDLNEGSYLECTIRDSGHGMSAEVVKRIFDPYFTTKPLGKGTGLGLSVVHGIIRSMGGTITVDSEVGKGSVFTFYLPLLAMETDQNLYDETLPPTSGIGRILFVDDEPPLADLGYKMLSRRGYDVCSVANSVQALQKFIDRPDAFDLVITDLAMPHMTGIELARKIHAARPAIPIILVTGNMDGLSLALQQKIGISRCLPKPYLSIELEQAVAAVLTPDNTSHEEGDRAR